jgi:hypothetical protein
MAWQDTALWAVLGARLVSFCLHRTERIEDLFFSPQGNWRLLVFDVVVFLAGAVRQDDGLMTSLREGEPEPIRLGIPACLLAPSTRRRFGSGRPLAPIDMGSLGTEPHSWLWGALPCRR